MDAYVILNVSEDADDAAIKEAYLSAVRQCPPERHPDMFAALRSAYESISTGRKRLYRDLFQPEPVDPMTVGCLCLANDQQPLFEQSKAFPRFSAGSLEKLFKQVLMESTESLMKTERGKT